MGTTLFQGLLPPHSELLNCSSLGKIPVNVPLPVGSEPAAACEWLSYPSSRGQDPQERSQVPLKLYRAEPPLWRAQFEASPHGSEAVSRILVTVLCWKALVWESQREALGYSRGVLLQGLG